MKTLLVAMMKILIYKKIMVNKVDFMNFISKEWNKFRIKKLKDNLSRRKMMSALLNLKLINHLRKN
jgi:hypothetical protein